MDVLLRSIGIFFDDIVYGTIPKLYNLFIEISNLSIVSNSTIKSFASRIYALIGVFMLFKVTFSLIMLLMNPDKINDSAKGLGNIVKRIMIALVLLPLVPWFFQRAFEVQNIILKNNILANIILGGDYSNNLSDDDPGESISYGVLSSFIQPDDEKYSNWITEEDLYKNDDSETKTVYEKYRNSLTYKDTETLLDIATEKDDDGDFIFNYTGLFSTIAGIFVCYCFVVYLLQVGFRSVKLSFLQLIAPIPILSYVDPSSEKTFKSWGKECFTTFLDVFVRLIIIYFVVLLISLLTQGGGFHLYEWGVDSKGKDIVAEPSFFASAFVIIGLLMFAMEAPKLIPQMLGLSSNGNFSLNPFKALGGAGFLAGAGIGAVTGGALGIAGSFAASRRLGHGVGRSLLSGATGGVSGLGRGAFAGSHEKSFSGAKSKGLDAGSIPAKKISARRGTSGVVGRTAAIVQNKLHLPSEFDQLEKRNQSYIASNNAYKNFKKALEDEVDKKDNQTKLAKAHWEKLINDPKSSEADRVTAEKAYFDTRKKAVTDLATAVAAGNRGDLSDANLALAELDSALKDNPEFYGDISSTRTYNADGSIASYMDGDTLEQFNKDITTQRVDLVTSDQYAKAKDNKAYGETVVGPHPHFDNYNNGKK